MRESDIEKALKERVNSLGGIALKLSAMHFTGIPDRLCLLPGGVAVFVELKAPSKKPRMIQAVVHDKLRSLGFRVDVIDNMDVVKRFK